MQVSNASIRTTARLSGFLFLWLIITGLSGLMIASNISGKGTFAEQSIRIVNSKHLYGFALSIELVETISAMLLAFTLYVVLRPYNRWIAQLGMYFRVGESIIGAVGVIFGFIKLYLYTNDAISEDKMQLLLNLVRHAGLAFYNVSAIFFSFGSLLFFYIFYKSKCIPRILSLIGIIASPMVTFLCFASLVYPEYSKWLQFGWLPMAIAEVGTGVWLLIYGVKYHNNETNT